MLDMAKADKIIGLNLVTPVSRQKSMGQLKGNGNQCRAGQQTKHKCIDCAKCIVHDQDYIINKKEGDNYLLSFPV